MIIQGSIAYLLGYFEISPNRLAHYSKFPLDSISGIDSLITSSATTKKLSSGEHTITDETVVNAMAIIIYSSASTTSFDEDISTYVTVDASTAISEISLSLGDFKAQVIENNSTELDIELTCVLSGISNPTLQYSLKANNANALPSWVTVDGTNMKLIVDPPNVDANSSFSFYIVTDVSTGEEYDKLATLEVTNIEEEEEKEVEPRRKTEKKIERSQTATTAILAGGVTVGAAASVASSSSPLGIWSLMNQFQMLLLLNILGVSLHQNVKDYIEGFDFTSFSFGFINTNNINVLGGLFNAFSCDIDNEDYELIGIEYRCTLINHIYLFILCLLLAALHLLILLLHSKYKENKN